VATKQREAKRFFVDKIVAQAVAEGEPLSNSERHMLSFSEAEPESVDPASDDPGGDDYEAKIAGLLKRAYLRDLSSDPGAKALYRNAHAVLSEGDHYLLVMTEKALGRAKPISALARLGLFMLLVVPGVLALLIGGVLGWALLEKGSAREMVEIGPFVLFLAWGGVFMIRVWLRDSRG
jgi:hypothetical protein